MAQRSEAEFRINFSAGDTNAVSQQVAQMFTAMTRESRKTAQSVSGIQGAFAKVGRSMQYALGSYVGVGALAGGVAAISQTAKEYKDNNAKFQRSIGQLIGQGTNSSKQEIKGLKREVVDLTAQMGIGTDQAASFLYNLQSGVEGLSNPLRMFKEIKKEVVQLNLLNNANPDQFVTAMTKAYHNFGNAIGDANLIQNKFFKTVELGAIEVDNFAHYAPVAMESAAALGVDMDQMLATIISATQRGATSQDVMTGVKNMMAIMAQQDKIDLVNEKLKGPDLELSGGYIEQLQQIREWADEQGSQGVIELFGQETFRTANSVLSALDLIIERTAELRAMSPLDDVVGERLGARITNDPGFMAAKATDAVAAMEANPIEFAGGYDPKDPRASLGSSYEAGKAHFIAATGTSIGSFLGGLAGVVSPRYANAGRLKIGEALGGADTEVGREYNRNLWASIQDEKIGAAEARLRSNLSDSDKVKAHKEYQSLINTKPPSSLFQDEASRDHWWHQNKRRRKMRGLRAQLTDVRKQGAAVRMFSGAADAAGQVMDPIYGAYNISTGNVDASDPAAVQSAIRYAEQQYALNNLHRPGVSYGGGGNGAFNPKTLIDGGQAAINHYSSKRFTFSQRSLGRWTGGAGALVGGAMAASGAAGDIQQSRNTELLDRIDRLTRALEENSSAVASRERLSRVPGGSRANSIEVN